MLKSAVDYTHSVLDRLDATLGASGEPRMAELVELANLSAMVGNLFRGGLAKNSDSRFRANRPHAYPDLLTNDERFADLEIKVALEKNKPKGHLVKPGAHLAVRYVLAAADGAFTPGKSHRGCVAWIWEVRAGWLLSEHFSVSNTAGDSGKTAVINAAGMDALAPVYLDFDRCPYGSTGRGRAIARYRALVE